VALHNHPGADKVNFVIAYRAFPALARHAPATELTDAPRPRNCRLGRRAAPGFGTVSFWRASGLERTLIHALRAPGAAARYGADPITSGTTSSQKGLSFAHEALVRTGQALPHGMR